MLSSDAEELLKKIDSRTERLETAIIGDSEIGYKGLVERVDVIENKQKKTDRKIYTAGALATGAMLGIKGLWEKFVTFL